MRDNVYGAVAMTAPLRESSLVHVMNAEQRTNDHRPLDQAIWLEPQVHL